MLKKRVRFQGFLWFTWWHCAEKGSLTSSSSAWTFNKKLNAYKDNKKNKIKEARTCSFCSFLYTLIISCQISSIFSEGGRIFLHVHRSWFLSKSIFANNWCSSAFYPGQLLQYTKKNKSKALEFFLLFHFLLFGSLELQSNRTKAFKIFRST